MRLSKGFSGQSRSWLLLICGFFSLITTGCIFGHLGPLGNGPETGASRSAPPQETPATLAHAANRPERPPPLEPKALLPVSVPTPSPEPPPPEPPQKPEPEWPYLEPVRASLTDRFGISLDGSENHELLRAVADWMGAPYEWGGCSALGVDCSCLVQTIYAEVFGLDINRTVRTMLKERLKNVDISGLREGDLLFFDMKDQGFISHVGIYIKSGAFVHASSSRGVMINRLTQPFYRARLVKAARLDEPSGGVEVARVSLGNLVVVRR